MAPGFDPRVDTVTGCYIVPAKLQPIDAKIAQPLSSRIEQGESVRMMRVAISRG